LGENINKARLKLIALFIIALNQARTVRFENLAIAFVHTAKKRIHPYDEFKALWQNLICNLIACQASLLFIYG